MDGNENIKKDDEMILCPKCGNVNNKNLHFCMFCNATLDTHPNNGVGTQNTNNTNINQSTITQASQNKETPISSNKSIFCPNCGMSNDANHNFCAKCGTSLPKDVKEMASYSNTNKEETKKQSSNKTIFYILIAILAIFLGYRYFPTLRYLVPILAVASLFNKETRPFGVTILSIAVVLGIAGLVFVVILFGACISAFG